MSQLLVHALVWHILFGLAGIILFTAFLLLIARREWNFKQLKFYSFLGTLAFFASWISGGYYYSTYYGKAVKPVILAGAYPWIHKVVMEAKEHIFLFLPFLALTLLLATFFSGKELQKNEKFKKAVVMIGFLVIALGLLIALAGVAISGAVVR